MTAAILSKLVADILKANPSVHAALVSNDPAKRKLANDFLQHSIDIALIHLQATTRSN